MCLGFTPGSFTGWTVGLEENLAIKAITGLLGVGGGGGEGGVGEKFHEAQ